MENFSLLDLLNSPSTKGFFQQKVSNKLVSSIHMLKKN